MTPPVLVDGGTATELERAGVPVEAPLWSAAALLAEEPRRVLRSIHASFLGAGAHVLTANTFRCNARAAQAAGLDRAGAAWLVHAAHPARCAGVVPQQPPRTARSSSSCQRSSVSAKSSGLTATGSGRRRS